MTFNLRVKWSQLKKPHPHCFIQDRNCDLSDPEPLNGVLKKVKIVSLCCFKSCHKSLMVNVKKMQPWSCCRELPKRMDNETELSFRYFVFLFLYHQIKANLPDTCTWIHSEKWLSMVWLAINNVSTCIIVR